MPTSEEKRIIFHQLDESWPDTFDIINAEYHGRNKDMILSCKKHGVQTKTAQSFLKYGCLACRSENRYLTKFKNKFGERFSYSELFIPLECNQPSRQLITIGCDNHGFSSIGAGRHLKIGCEKCQRVEQFIEKGKRIYSGRYDYRLVKDIGTSTNPKMLSISCQQHGLFFQYYFIHFHSSKQKRGIACPYCAIENAHNESFLSQADFIMKAKKIHGDKYDYSSVEYAGMRKQVVIICPKHGEYEQLAAIHIRGSGCKSCGIEKMSKSKRWNTSHFIREAKKKHGHRFDYTNTCYSGRVNKIDVRCVMHNLRFKQNPHNHLNKLHNCPECVKEEISSNTQEFVRKAKAKHGELFDYSEVVYIGAHKHVKLICPKHEPSFMWKTKPSNHLSGNGCPLCSSSKGERAIEQYLSIQNIRFQPQKYFSDLGKFYYDFFLPDYNVLIEYDGEQHFMPVEYFGGLTAFKKLKLSDKKKTIYAQKKGYLLLRIPYTMYEDIDACLSDLIASFEGNNYSD